MATFKTYLVIIVTTLLFFPKLVNAQKESSFEIRFQYGVLKTFNRSELISASPTSHFNLSSEKELTTRSYAIEAVYHFNKRNSFNVNIGTFENGSLISGQDNYFNFENVSTNYLYYSLGFGHVLNFNLPLKTQLNFENGVMLLRRKSSLNTRFFQIKKMNYQYVTKLGISKKIGARLILATQLTFHYGIGNFSSNFVENGFKPYSIGWEISGGYMFNYK